MAPYVKLTVTEPVVTILTLDRQRFVKTEFHRNETAGLFADARSWTDGRKWSPHEALFFIVHKRYLERKSIRQSNFWA